jgi:hypothetical protein
MSVASADSVLLEIVDVASAARLAERLVGRWNVELSADRREVMVVLVELGAESADLALLLREVEAWVEEESLCSVRYALDGRPYVLTAGEGDWSLDAAEEIDVRVGRQRARLVRALDSVDRAMSALAAPGGQKTQIRGLEGLRKDLVLALRLIEESS